MYRSLTVFCHHFIVCVRQFEVNLFKLFHNKVIKG